MAQQAAADERLKSKKCNMSTLTRRQLEEIDEIRQKQAREKYWERYLVQQNRYLNKLEELGQSSKSEFEQHVLLKDKFLFGQLSVPPRFYDTFMQHKDLKITKRWLNYREQYDQLQEQKKQKSSCKSFKTLAFQRKQEKRLMILPSNKSKNSILVANSPHTNKSHNTKESLTDDSIIEYIVSPSTLHMKLDIQNLNDNINQMYHQILVASHQSFLSAEQKRFFGVFKSGSHAQIARAL